ncbi:exocyst complex component EXO70A1 isoform X2 [Rhododendron vialii]|nr:exocyst complex component EXO70A1 isoform X2 [Rhododendron vialii]
MRRAHENIDKTLKAAEVFLGQFDLSRQAEAKILRGPHEDLESYLEAVDQLRSIVHFFSGNKSLQSSIGVLNHANNLLSKAILKLEEEFRQLLTSYSKPVEPDRLFDCLPNCLRPSSGSPGQGDANGKKLSSTNHKLEAAIFTVPTLIPPRILPLLHDLAQQMVHAGHQQQLFTIYRETRAAVLEQSLRKLGVEKLGKEDVQRMQWEVLEAKIGNWIHFMRISVKLLFAGEKKVCDQIFEGVDSLKEQCFADVTATSVAVLLSFGEAIAKSKRSPEKLFVLLDMYELMRELQPEMETNFQGKYCMEMRESAVVLTKRLAQTAQETFGDFEEAVEKDATKTAVLDGTVHPLTSYVINYVKFLFDYQSTLKLLFQEFDEGDADARLTAVTTRIMQALQSNLDGKSKQYKDPALTQLFLMNNIHYIVRSVRRSEAKDLLGDDWVQIHRRIVQQHANQYKRISWSKILQCLTVQGLSSSSGGQLGSDSGSNSGLSRAMVKERFKTFNIQFEELHQRQSQWSVPDSELRESLRLAVAEVLLPAFRSFIRRFGPMIENGKNPQKYIRFSPEDLERMLAEFFEGKTWSEQKR